MMCRALAPRGFHIRGYVMRNAVRGTFHGTDMTTRISLGALSDLAVVHCSCCRPARLVGCRLVHALYKTSKLKFAWYFVGKHIWDHP